MTVRMLETEPGVRIAVRDLGEGEPVLLLHGWTLNHLAWDRQIRLLAEAGHRVVAMDLRGHGRSDAPLRGYDIERLAADARSVLAQLDLERVGVVGWSLGGMTALRLAATDPGRVGRLVLVGSTGVAASRHEGYPFGVPAGVVGGAMRAGEHADRIGHRRHALVRTFGAPPPEHVVDHLHALSLQTPSWVADACMTTLLYTEQLDLLDGLSVPMTQISGTGDPFVDADAARWLSRRVGSTLVELDCGHYPMFEVPDEFDVAMLKGLTS